MAIYEFSGEAFKREIDFVQSIAEYVVSIETYDGATADYVIYGLEFDKALGEPHFVVRRWTDTDINPVGDDIHLDYSEVKRIHVY